jgi:PAS domain S-box-containing protein
MDIQHKTREQLIEELAAMRRRVADLEKSEMESKTAREVLQGLSGRQEALLAAFPDIIMEVDSAKVYTWANQAGTDFFGEDVVGKEAALYFEGDQDTYEVVTPLFRGDENVIYLESWQRRKDGQKRLLAWWCQVLKDGKGNVVGALSSARDITEARQAEEEREHLLEHLKQRVQERTAELQEANELLRQEIERRKATERVLQLERNKLTGILESMNDGVYIVNQNYDIQYINPLIEKEFGPVNGRKCHEYFHDLPTVCPWCKNQEVFAGKSVQWDWHYFKTGKTYDAFDTPILNEDGSVAKLKILHDITEHKRVEESLRKALSEIKTLKDQFEAENIYFRQEVKLKYPFGHIIGQSKAFKYVLHRAEQVASANTTVLIYGETGTGKELIATAIHQMSPRKDRPLVTVNCAALPANLIESELFGREKGAFTGADTRQVGRFEVANGSTLCLDEIGELPLEVQAKLLRVIQHHEFERLGSSHTLRVDVRIVATTNRNLEEEVRKGRFRQDLYYRLNIFPIAVPPLRQRKEDIPLLVQAFIERYAKELGKQVTSIQKETMKALQDYSWPGNVRELENVIERAMILCPGSVLQLADKLESPSLPLSSVTRTLRETERDQILETLSETRWRINGKKGAAAILGLHPSTLRARMQKLGIRRPEPKLSE